MTRRLGAARIEAIALPAPEMGSGRPLRSNGEEMGTREARLARPLLVAGEWPRAGPVPEVAGPRLWPGGRTPGTPRKGAT